MASPPITRARLARDDASNFDKLPPHLLSEVLQLLPAKDLCRLRAVCRSWRSITSDRAFIRAHADWHKEPHFLAKFRDEDRHVYVVDLSGNVVKKIAGADGGLQLLRTRLNRACLATEQNTSCRVLNPATGGILVIPPVPLIANRVIMSDLCNFFALGLVASTEEYKLLHQWRYPPFNPCGSRVQVLTINLGTESTDKPAQWRSRPGPSHSIDVRSGVVVDGVVYFLSSSYYILPLEIERYHAGTSADFILSFDLAGEEWRRVLHPPSGQMLRTQLNLADLNGTLVLAHHPRSLSILDLWFLLDFESTLWVKQYSIRTESVTSSLVARYHLIPLWAFDDGRLVIHLAPTGLLFICDPGTNTFTRVDIRHHLDSVGVYTGSLLSLQEEDMV